MSIVNDKGLAYYDKKSQARNGYWESQENVKDGDVRLLAGKDGTAFILECVVAGETDDVQPKVPSEYYESEYAVSYEELADYTKTANSCLATADKSMNDAYEAVRQADKALAKTEENIELIETKTAEMITTVETKTNEMVTAVDEACDKADGKITDLDDHFVTADSKLEELNETLAKGYQLKAIRVTEEDIDEMFKNTDVRELDILDNYTLSNEEIYALVGGAA